MKRLLVRSIRPALRWLARFEAVHTLGLPVARRAPRSQWLFRSLPVERTFRVRLEDDRSFLYRSTERDFIGRDLYWFGIASIEPETTSVFFRLAESCSVALDIGANTGLFSLLAATANPSARVLAVEPVARVADLLAANIRLNGLEDRCTVLRGAASSAEGRRLLHVPVGGIPTSSSLNPRGFRGLEGELVSVQCHSIDAICRSLPSVDLVKIDVEGFEDQVLQGMEETLERSRPRLIVECNPDGPYRQVEEFLGERGFLIYHLTSKGPQLVETVVPDREERNRNFLFSPESLSDPLLSRLSGRWGSRRDVGSRPARAE